MDPSAVYTSVRVKLRLRGVLSKHINGVLHGLVNNKCVVLLSASSELYALFMKP